MATTREDAAWARSSVRPLFCLIAFWSSVGACVLLVRCYLAGDWPTLRNNPLHWWPKVGAIAVLGSACLATGKSATLADRSKLQPARRFQQFASGFVLAALVLAAFQVAALWQLHVVAGTRTGARPNLNYLVAVFARLEQLRQPHTTLTTEQRATVDDLQDNLCDWTSGIVGQAVFFRQTDVAFRRNALLALAQDIYPQAENRSQVNAHLAKEAEWIAAELPLLQIRRREMQANEQKLSKEFRRASEEPLGQEANRGDNAKLAAELTELETQGQAMDKTIARLLERQEFRSQRGALFAGLQAEHPWLQLPICVAGGASWFWTAFLTTSLLCLVCVVGLLISWLWRTDALPNSESKDLRYKLGFLKVYWGTATLASLGLMLFV